MHEYAAVEALVTDLVAQLEARRAGRVEVVRLCRGSSFDEDALHQAYAMLTAGTLLEHAPCEVMVEEQALACACGHRQVVTSADLIGHMVVCPACGMAEEVENAHDLAVVEVVAVVEDDEPTLARAPRTGGTG